MLPELRLSAIGCTVGWTTLNESFEISGNLSDLWAHGQESASTCSWHQSAWLFWLHFIQVHCLHPSKCRLSTQTGQWCKVPVSLHQKLRKNFLPHAGVELLPQMVAFMAPTIQTHDLNKSFEHSMTKFLSCCIRVSNKKLQLNHWLLCDLKQNLKCAIPNSKSSKTRTQFAAELFGTPGLHFAKTLCHKSHSLFTSMHAEESVWKVHFRLAPSRAHSRH